jgi:regulator of replication initiation timing
MTMFDSRDIEDIILGMADMVLENRRLRKENNELRLECARYKAWADSYFNKEAQVDYDILWDIKRNNMSVNMCDSLGWKTNQDYIEDWEDELEKRRAALKGETSK